MSADDAGRSSFIFLARRDDLGFGIVDDWLDESEHMEGHQFFCHAACFTGRMDPVMRRAAFDPNF